MNSNILGSRSKITSSMTVINPETFKLFSMLPREQSSYFCNDIFYEIRLAGANEMVYKQNLEKCFKDQTLKSEICDSTEEILIPNSQGFFFKTEKLRVFDRKSHTLVSEIVPYISSINVKDIRILDRIIKKILIIIDLSHIFRSLSYL